MKTARLSIYFINHLLIWLPFIFFLTLAQQSNSQTVLENFKPCVSYYLSGDQLVGGDVGIPNDLHRDYVAEDTFSFTLNFA